MTVWSDLRTDLFPWVWATHSALIVGGFVVPFWAMVPLCMFGMPNWLTLSHMVIWLVLTLSPFLGLLAVWKQQLRQAYLLLAVSTPIYCAVVMSLQFSGLTYCDGP